MKTNNIKTNNANSNNTNDVRISDETRKMIRLFKEFTQWQERFIPVFEEEIGGENAIEATAEVYQLIKECISAHICETMADTRLTEI